MTNLNILNSTELKAFESPPVLNSEERKKFFNLPAWTIKEIETFKSSTNKVGFVLLLGYFRAVKRVFSVDKYYDKDRDYVTNKLGIPLYDVDLKKYNRKTMNRHKKIIFDNMGFQLFTDKNYELLLAETNRLAAKQLRPKMIFTELIGYLMKNKIEIPYYNTFATIITNAINRYEGKLIEIVMENLTERNKKLLDSLLKQKTKNEIEDNQQSEPHYYKLTLLKKINQSLRPKKIRKNINDFNYLQSMFTELKPVIDRLNLSQDVIIYYSGTVYRADAYKISRKTEEKQYLHLISFIIHQYYKQHDTLVDILLKAVQSNINSANKEYKDKSFEERKDLIRETDKLLKNINTPLAIIERIKDIIISNDLSDNEKINNIKAILSKDASIEMNNEQIKPLQSKITSSLKDKLHYDILSSKSRKLQNKVSDIILHLRFNEEGADQNIMNAIKYYKTKDKVPSKDAPTDFLDDEQEEIIWDDEGRLKVSLYKVFLFEKIAHAIKSGSLNLIDSYKYRSFDEYLISKDKWNKNKDEYIKKAELEAFIDANKVLSELSDILDKAYHTVNQNILSAKNEFVRFDKKDNLIINTPKVEKPITDSISDLFPADRYISLSEVLSTINKYSNFLDAFAHWQIKHSRKTPPEKTFLASVIGFGCNLGIRKIARISKNINEYELENTINWYFDPDNVDGANDKIIKFMDKLILPNKIKHDDEKNHTSSDGQKYGIRVDSLNANYSFKYGGNKPAISAYSFIDSRHFLFHSTVISSSEREAAYVIDGILNNQTVKSDIHSTDTHGYTETIFGITHLLGFSFAPRIKNVNRQSLHSFEKIKYYESFDYRLLPDRYVQEDIIKEDWDNILRVIATLKLKEATASQLFKRLSSYSKHHPIYRAIKAFGQIIKSVFLLKYIDDVMLRHSIQRQLNIGENSNKFSKAVFYGNNQDFMFATKEEQEIVEGCKRLIKNAIICWNYLYLSQLLADADADTDNSKKRIFEITINGSIEVWEHINLHGEFDFTDEKLMDLVGFKIPKILDLNLDEF